MKSKLRLYQLAMLAAVICIARSAAADGATYRGGPLMSNPHIALVSWGRQDTGKLQSFLAVLDPHNTTNGATPSPYANLTNYLQQYNVPGSYTYGHMKYDGIYTITPALQHGNPLKDDINGPNGSEIISELLFQMNAGKVPRPTPNLLYIVSLPKGVQVQNKFNQLSCTDMCGYHDYAPPANTGQTSDIYYAVLPDFMDTTTGCYQATMQHGICGHNPDDTIGPVASHEIAEAFTDPRPGQGWYNNTWGEVGDICTRGYLGDASISYVDQQPRASGGAEAVQKEWSNTAADCVDLEVDHLCCTSTGVTFNGQTCVPFPPSVSCWSVPSFFPATVPQGAVQMSLQIFPNTPHTLSVVNSGGCPPTGSAWNTGLANPGSDSCQIFSGTYTPTTTPENLPWFAKSNVCFGPQLVTVTPPVAVCQPWSGRFRTQCTSTGGRFFSNNQCCTPAPAGGNAGNGNYCLFDIQSLN
jgi:hypothetical protein